jgi:hypothetical protein
VAAEPLPGGSVTAVVRVRDTVRRRPAARADHVHELLRWLERRGWPSAPRVLGTDGAGREVLTFLDGVVPWEPPPPAYVTAPAALLRTGQLVRELHDLTAGSPLAEGCEVVCHNDLSPGNTVYRDAGAGLVPVAFIDWDTAAPGDRLHDVGHVCWQFAGPAPGADPDVVGDRMRLVCDGYDLPDRGGVLDALLWWQDRCARGIDDAAAAGDAARARLRDAGVPAAIRAASAWVHEHRAELSARL